MGVGARAAAGAGRRRPAVRPPERIADVRVVLVGYRDRDHGPRAERVDMVDARTLTTLMSLSPADARTLAARLVEVAGWAPGHDPGE